MPVIPLPGAQPLPAGAEGWCGWDIDPAGQCPDWDTYTPEQQELASNIAVLVMWAATGRRYGPCEITVRPCQSKERAETYRAYPVFWGSATWAAGMPYLDGGRWFNCGCGSGCCCRARCEIMLDGPVSSIVEVLVDGDVVPPEEYRVDVTQGGYRLVKTSDGCWPTCQDFNVGGEDVGSFSVTYGRGLAVPGSVLGATGLLACEFGKQVSSGSCALPQRLSSLTRQGVTADFIVNEIDVSTFQTGISLVDMVIRAENPSRLTRPPTVLSPDLPDNRDRMTIIGGP